MSAGSSNSIQAVDWPKFIPVLEAISNQERAETGRAATGILADWYGLGI